MATIPVNGENVDTDEVVEAISSCLLLATAKDGKLKGAWAELQAKIDGREVPSPYDPLLQSMDLLNKNGSIPNAAHAAVKATKAILPDTNALYQSS